MAVRIANHSSLRGRHSPELHMQANNSLDTVTLLSSAALPRVSCAGQLKR